MKIRWILKVGDGVLYFAAYGSAIMEGDGSYMNELRAITVTVYVMLGGFSAPLQLAVQCRVCRTNDGDGYHLGSALCGGG